MTLDQSKSSRCKLYWQTARRKIELAGDTESGVKVSVELAVELIEQVKSWAGGAYIMPQFHRYDMVAEIIEAVK